MNNFKLIISLLMLPNINTAYASSDNAATLPPDMLFHGRPIDPNCMQFVAVPDEALKKTIHLKECTKDSEANLIHRKDGAIGRSSTANFNKDYNYYRYLGEKDGLIILYMETGGSGNRRFSSVAQVKRDSDTITWVGELGGGDRCNGGIANAFMHDDKVIVDKNMTPYDIVKSTWDKPDSNELESYRLLDNGANNCAGIGSYEDNIMVSVKLNPKPYSLDNRGPQGCFNQFYNDSLKQGITEFNAEALRAFNDRFNAQCTVIQ